MRPTFVLRFGHGLARDRSLGRRDVAVLWRPWRPTGRSASALRSFIARAGCSPLQPSRRSRRRGASAACRPRRWERLRLLPAQQVPLRSPRHRHRAVAARQPPRRPRPAGPSPAALSAPRLLPGEGTSTTIACLPDRRQPRTGCRPPSVAMAVVAPPEAPFAPRARGPDQGGSRAPAATEAAGAATIAIAAALALGIYALAIDGGRAATEPAARPTRPSAFAARRSSRHPRSSRRRRATSRPPSRSKNISSRACALPREGRSCDSVPREASADRAATLGERLSAFGRRGRTHALGGRNGATSSSPGETGVRIRQLHRRPETCNLLLHFRDGLRLAALESSPDVPGPALPACDEVVDPPPGVTVSQLLRYG